MTDVDDSKKRIVFVPPGENRTIVVPPGGYIDIPIDQVGELDYDPEFFKVELVPLPPDDDRASEKVRES